MLSTGGTSIHVPRWQWVTRRASVELEMGRVSREDGDFALENFR
jgi:hypothetical protein